MSTSSLNYAIVWGHGITHLENILNMIENESEFKILHVEKFEKIKVSEVINAAYSHDYAPIWHLKEKVRYLRRVPKSFALIVVKNICPNWDYFGEKSFRHLECRNLKKLKDKIRKLYNPKKPDGSVSEDHVIHFGDNTLQAHIFLKFLGMSDGVNLFLDEWRVANVRVPYYLRNFDYVRFRKVNINRLYCRILTEDKNGIIATDIIPIHASPHFSFVSGDSEAYKNYIKRFRGRGLNAFYSERKFTNLTTCFSPDNYSLQAPILVEEKGEKILVLDGLHRASVLLRTGEGQKIVCQLLKN